MVHITVTITITVTIANKMYKTYNAASDITKKQIWEAVDNMMEDFRQEISKTHMIQSLISTPI
ncbi:GL26005 [Drosophila persimilis]|uniref:GL26005 n=1 Tax=Drosophila persimilis TaxID=7234 RepID=B4GK42_DROPE|nr:GL26005 [Drosophila persimilis]